MGILNLFIDKNAHMYLHMGFVPLLFFFFFFFCAFLCTLPLLFLSFFSWAIGVIVVLFCFVFLFCLTRHDFFGYDFYFLINLGDCFFLGGLFTTFLF